MAKLSKTQWKHIRGDAGCRSLEEWKRCREEQRRLGITCRDCEGIEKTLERES